MFWLITFAYRDIRGRSIERLYMKLTDIQMGQYPLAIYTDTAACMEFAADITIKEPY